MHPERRRRTLVDAIQGDVVMKLLLSLTFKIFVFYIIDVSLRLQGVCGKKKQGSKGNK